MTAGSVKAYDPPERVRRYDADMDIMHPLRHKMIEIALDTLPYPDEQSLRVLDLGTGTGAFALEFLKRYLNASVVAIDGSSAMLELARARLDEYAQRVDFVAADFRSIPAEWLVPESLDVVISSYALHHLDADEKREVLRTVLTAVKPGGWFLNADLVVAESPDFESRVQEIRVNAVTNRAPVNDGRFSSAEATRKTLDALEEAEQDQPLTLSEDLRVIRAAGIANADLIWKEYREVVVGGWKSDLPEA